MPDFKTCDATTPAGSTNFVEHMVGCPFFWPRKVEPKRLDWLGRWLAAAKINDMVSVDETGEVVVTGAAARATVAPPGERRKSYLVVREDRAAGNR
jgi:hypothetical protein